MHNRTALSVLLALAVVASVAGATTVPASQPIDAVGAVETPPASASDGAGGASGDGSDTDGDDETDYTRLYIEDRYTHLRLKPGEDDSVTVTVENVDEEGVEIDPHLVSAHPRARPIPGEWVTVDPSGTELDPDEETEITVEVSVPEDAELGDYHLQLALTDERITYPGRPSRPVHSVDVNVDVWREPTVHVLAGRHLYTQIEAGEGFTHEIVVENTGDEAVPLSPGFENERHRRYPRGGTADRSWFEIDAPNEIEPGETATVEVTITPPADANRGRYGAELDLGIKDPTRDERDTHWQRVRLNFQVWKQPDEPFATEFEVSEDAKDVTLTLSPQSARYRGTGGDDDRVSFDVEFVSPDGTTIEADRVEVSDRGYVDLSGERDGPVVGDGDYAVRGPGQEFVYRVDAPESGTWEVRVMPHNTVGFRYEIVRNEADE